MGRKRVASGARSARKKRGRQREGGDPKASLEPAAQRPAALIVCIGASAGGVGPLQTILSKVPSGTGLAFVVVQHAGQKGDRLLSKLLAESTGLEVVIAANEMPLLAERIHIMPAGSMLAVVGGVLAVPPLDHCTHLRQPIDHFMCCLAVDQGERAVGVLLSGAGMDGTQGLTDIKAAGGTVLVQDPQTAEFPDMARSAIAAVHVDAILPPEQIAPKLVELAHRHLALTQERREDLELAAVLRAVQAATGHDFGGYKRGTLSRRIARRMGLLQVKSYADYARYLRADVDEARLLRRDLLIGVTEFFRQPEAWAVLESKCIAELVAQAAPGATLRAWVPACATGKEAYSLAILLAEAVQRSGKSLAIQIFATDADEKALEVARAGAFSAEELAVLSPARRQRFFSAKDGQFQVVKQLRELLIFAPQDLTADPPFSRLDLVSCRNLLIYLDHDLQRKVIAIFHFSLREGGFLFLGSAETVGGQDDLFETVSKKWRIYRRIGATRPGRLELPLRPAAEPRPPFVGVPVPGPRPTLTNIAQQAMLERFAPPAVIVDRKGQLVFAQGAVEHFLRIPAGEQRGSVIDMAREGLRTHLRRLIASCAQDRRLVTAVARMKRGGKPLAVKVTVLPLRYPRETEGLMLVTFEEQRFARPAAAPVEAGSESEVERLEEELKVTKEELHSTISQLEQSNEHLKASNEEVIASNEELQAANEEMETSKEELQSLNEELNAVNLRLQEKVEELESINNDILNLLSSTSIATLFLDRELKVRRFTPAVMDLFSLIASDLGRPVADVRRLFEDPNLLTDAGRVLADLRPSGTEVRAADGRWYLRRITPYRTQDDRIEGVVITFTDFSDRKAAERHREWHLDRMRVLLAGTQGILAACDLEALLARIADAARELTGANLSTCGHGHVGGEFRVGAASHAPGRPPCPPGQDFCIAKGGAYLDLVQKSDSIRLTDAELRGRPDWWGLPEAHAPLRGRMGTRLVNAEGKPSGLIMVSDKADGGDFTAEDENLLRQLAAVASLALQHIEARDRAEQSAQRANWLARFPEENPNPILRIDSQGALLYANPAARACGVWCLEIGQTVEGSLLTGVQQALSQGQPIHLEQVAGDRAYWLTFAPVPLAHFVNVYIRDISERKAAEEALRESQQQNAFLAGVVENSSQAFAVGYPDGRLGLFNHALEQLTGYSAEELRTIDWAKVLTPPEWLAGEREKLEELNRTGQPVRYEKEYIRKDGTRVPIELLVHLARDEQGQPLYYYAFITKITERKAGEEQLRRWTAVLVAFNRILHETLAAPTVEKLGQLCLDIAGTLIGSPFGFIGEVGADGFLHDLAISEMGWDVCAMYDKSGHRRAPGNFPIHGLYGRVLVDGKSLLVNEPAAHPDSIGVPPGHPQLTSFLGVPFVREGKAIGMIVLANRPGGFRPQDQAALETLAPAIWEALARKRTQDELRQSTERLGRSQEIAHLGSWELDLLTNELIWSDEVYRIFGLIPQEFGATYEAFLEHVHPDDRAAVDEAYSGSLRDNRDMYEIEHRVLRKSGEIRFVQERCQHIRDASGKIVCSLGMVHDITERKIAEQALRESEHRYRTLFETMTEGFALCEIICDESGKPRDFRFLAMNPAFEKHTGLPVDQVVGRTLLELFPSAEHVWIERYGKVALTGVPSQFVNWFEPLERFFEVVAFQTQPGQVAVIFTDVTERVKNEEQLTADLSALTRMHALSTRVLEAEGIESMMQEIMDAAVAVVGADKGTLQLLEDDSLRIVVHHGHQQPFLEFFAAAENVASACDEATRQGRRVIVEDVNTSPLFAGTASGEVLREAGVRAVQSTPLMSRNGKLLGILTTHWGEPHVPDEHDLWRLDLLARQASDLIEQRLADLALRAAKDELEQRVTERTAELHRRAEQLSMLASELTLAEQRERRRLAQVLHDHLQQLLVGAKFGLEVLARRVAQDQVTSVEQVRDLLDESIAASRSLTMELSPPILHEAGLAAGLEWLARWMKEKHGLAVDLKLDERAGTDREDVRVLLFQSVRELLFNVVKHAGVTRASVKMEAAEGDTLRVTVSDAGVGFDPDTIWERSSQIAGGFGLISIRERLGMLGGTLEIQSAPQAGSRFILRAPAKSVGAPGSVAAVQPAPRLPYGGMIGSVAVAAPGKIRVLLADDHLVMRQGLAALLGEHEDIVVIGQADNGRQAVDLAAQLAPDVILMDFSMPLMDGLEATRLIHAELPNIRIIGLSMYEEADRAEAMLQAGASAYYTKSGDPDQLLAEIRKRNP